MSSDLGDDVIRVEGVSKRYQLGRHSAGLLSERVAGLLHPRRTERRAAAQTGEHWALRGVSLHVRHGEVVGLVGRNGAGKSTLLKILSGVTRPTEGRAHLRGRIGSLLEVGTGFHPELNGRENVFLNGAILGMRRAEIAARYDEIVEFAGVERFMETPVKRYSSGMKVRLGFAVAAHLEPEILVIDEVLAVGDAEFQRRSMRKLREISGQDRTILFVSHNLSIVKQMCDRAYLLRDGRVAFEGTSDEVVGAYLHEAGSVQSGGTVLVHADTDRIGSGEARLTRLELLDHDDQPASSIALDTAVRVGLTVEVRRAVEDVTVELGVSSVGGTRVATAHATDAGRPPLSLAQGTHRLIVELELGLLPGDYAVDVGLHDTSGVTLDAVSHVLDFAVENVARHSADRWPWAQVRGSVRPPSRWSVLPAGDPAPPPHR